MSVEISRQDAFGSDSPCNLDLCPIEWSMFQYRPNLGANAFFLAIFGVIGLAHGYLGWRWKSWGFMAGIIIGCICEMIGYVGRIMMWDNPFSFNAFMIQIVCLTIAPVFFTASIYVTLSRAIIYFDPALSRFKPQLFYWIFIPLDIICLILQAAGGAMSTEEEGSNNVGVTISMVGLILQVVVLAAFLAAFGDYMIRYFRVHGFSGFGWRLNAFFAGLTTSSLLILGRCIFRVAELREGYDGELITHEIPFIILEGVFIVLAVAALFWGHPGLALKDQHPRKSSASDSESGIAMSETQ